MISKLRAIPVICILVLGVITVRSQSLNIRTAPATIWDDKPAHSGMNEAYPQGNGRIGTMVSGNASQEHIQFNELSLWTGDEKETGAYQPFGDLYLDVNPSQKDFTSDYHRELSLDKALQTVRYQQGRVTFKREYFCSFPGRVFVSHFSAKSKFAYNVRLRMKDAHGQPTTTDGTFLKFKGQLKNGLIYYAALRVITDGGEVKFSDGGEGNTVINIKRANGFTILMSAATSYSNNRAKHWRGADPQIKVTRLINEAGKKGYQALLTEHLRDYSNLFNRVHLTLGPVYQAQLLKPTLERIKQYQTMPDPALEALLYQYGRYLLISSSRKGGLPANLQGIWNDDLNPPWRSDYHSNINIQMNYWLAEPTNLSECHIPYLEYINSIRAVSKENTQNEFGKVRGWTVRTENNIFGGSGFLWNTPASAWYAQGLWEHFAFTRDTTYLRNFAYPIHKEIVNFWDDYLERRPDGTLVSPMGWSPEHGPREDGVTYDQAIVDDLFSNYVEAAGILQIDTAYRKHVATMREHLLKPKIGRWGQLQEWETDRDDPKDTHRHSSNLFGLHPGKSISTLKTPDLAQAAKISLEARGDASTGWSMAWKINFWARLQEGDHAYRILKNFISLAGGSVINYNEGGGVYPNLLCAHPPFQIDGNFGYTAGLTEMLLQSQTEEIQLLPALPNSWKNGEVQGLKARGGFEISNMKWRDGKLVAITIRSHAGGLCRIRSPNPLAGGKISWDVQKFQDTTGYSFLTEAGKSYSFTSL